MNATSSSIYVEQKNRDRRWSLMQMVPSTLVSDLLNHWNKESKTHKFCNIVFPIAVNYRPQRSCGKVMFSQTCVKNSVHMGCLPKCMLGYIATLGRHPPGRHLSWGDIPQAETTWADTPLGRHPPGQTHSPGQTRSPGQTSPPPTIRQLLLWMVRILLECFLVMLGILE